MATSREELRREQEFYRYYHPVLRRTCSEPVAVDLADAQSTAQHVPRSSADTALTAFCQLGALRLGTRRSMIFSFDTKNAYVLAEATRTLSLQDDSVHEPQDDLWLGHTVLPRGYSVCEHTVNIPSANKGSNQNHSNAGIVHIVNNLEDDVRFCDRPFVTDGPRARFYAGVPLVAASGVRIGVYCVLDDKPRDGLNDTEVDFLCQMSRTVMDHLEVVRLRSEYGTGSQMLTSLADFYRATDICPSPGTATPEPENSNSGDESAPNRSPVKRKFGITAASGSPKNESTSEVQKTFETAANLIRIAADADGVAFLQPYINSSEGKIHGPHNQRAANCADFTSTDDISTDTDGSSHRTRLPCPVLAYAGPPDGEVPRKALPVKKLKSLLNRYPEGKVWLFNSSGELYSETNDSASDTGQSKAGNDDDDTSLTDAKIGARRLQRAKRAAELQAFFPGARALCLVNLWDPVRETTYAGCLVWSKQPSRIFTSEGELSYVRAFCGVVASNISRIEARKMDEMKSQFISSVSHELRSPLHGIIGSVDFLQEQQCIDWSIILQIEKCSTALMDVIDHLLDFAKVNDLNSSQARARGHQRRGQNIAAARDKVKLHSLSQTTAEIADVVYYSHCQTTHGRQCEDVDFILDVSTDLALDYTVPVGVWKRICMNIINNALKYTSKGHILVSLKIVQGTRKLPVAIFTVKDTGCGMSQEFLENRLFKAFTQEDSLSVGTGLGMSLVAKLVTGLSGKIQVQSAKDIGTTFKVTIPLDVQTKSAADTTFAMPLEGLKVRVLALPPDATGSSIDDTSRHLHLTALHRTFRHLGAVLVDGTPDVDFLWEADLSQYSPSLDGLDQLAPSVVVLCNTVMSACKLQNQPRPKWKRKVEYLARPFGPERLIQGLERLREQLDQPNDQDRHARQQCRTVLDVKQTEDSQLSTATTHHAEADKTSRRKSQIRLLELVDKIQASQEVIDLGNCPNNPDNTVVTATLSLESSDSASEPPTPAMTPGDEKQIGLSKLPLLLVDDNPINLRLLTVYAKRNSHPHITAMDGAEAVEKYKASVTTSTPSRVIFMDINMPNMDGFEATRLIRAFEKSQGVPRATVVALTGLGSNDAREEAMASGIDIFLTKPVRPKELKQLLEEIAEQKCERAL